MILEKIARAREALAKSQATFDCACLSDRTLGGLRSWHAPQRRELFAGGMSFRRIRGLA